MYNVVIVIGFCSVAILFTAAERAVDNVRFSNRLILLMQSCEIIFFFWSSEFFVVGILYKEMHKLLPDESHSFLDGYVLNIVEVKHAWVAYLNLIISELSPTVQGYRNLIKRN